MQIEFNQEEYIEQMKIIEQLRELQERKKTLQDKIDEMAPKTKDIRNYLQRSREELKKYNIFSRISAEKRKKIAAIKKSINKEEKDLEAHYKIINNINEQIDRLQRQIEELEKSKKEISIPSSLKTDGSQITITDESTIPTKKDARDDYVMVHCTDFFPKDRKILCNYDGKKTGEEVIIYNGVSKKCKTLSHRHSCHFALNNVVRPTGDGAGNWNQPKFVIIDPLDINNNNFVNIDPSDSYTYGSARLSEKPILLVREDIYEEIPVDQLQNYNVIKYSGYYITCVQNAISLFGYVIRETNANSPSHDQSEEKKLEHNLNIRNLCLNYIFDNMYNGEDIISISDEEMTDFFEIFKQQGSLKSYPLFVNKFYIEISKLSGIPIDFVKLVINSGITKDNDKFSFKDDDKMYYETIKIVDLLNNKNYRNEEEWRDIIIENINIKELQEIYETYITCISAKNNNDKNVNNSDALYDEIKNLDISEIFKFKNHDKALILVGKINEIITDRKLSAENPEISSDGVIIRILVFSKDFDIGKLIENGYEVEDTGFDTKDYFNLIINFKQKKIKDMLQELDNYLENLYFYSKSKSSFEQAQAEFESLTEEERKKMTEDQRSQEEFQQSSSHTR